MEHLRDAIAVVTGASSGIGAAIAKDLLDAGLVVIALGRRPERVDQLRSSLPQPEQRRRLHGLRCDVGDAAEVEQVFERIAREFGSVRVLVNSAGCLRSGQLCCMDAASVQEVWQTNVMGVVNCTRHAFRAMQEAALGGHVVLINSVFGHHVTPIPGHVPALAMYPATKHALTAINEIYRQEFQALGTSVKVTSISPGLVDTPFITEKQKRICQGKILQAEDVARAVLFALAAPAHVQIAEVVIKPMGELI